MESGRALELRERSGLSQREVAQACDVTQVAVLRWEQNERRPRTKHAVAYHRLLSRLAARELA